LIAGSFISGNGPDSGPGTTVRLQHAEMTTRESQADLQPQRMLDNALILRNIIRDQPLEGTET
jgi:hypothetical protein